MESISWFLSEPPVHFNALLYLFFVLFILIFYIHFISFWPSLFYHSLWNFISSLSLCLYTSLYYKCWCTRERNLKTNLSFLFQKTNTLFHLVSLGSKNQAVLLIARPRGQKLFSVAFLFWVCVFLILHRFCICSVFAVNAFVLTFCSKLSTPAFSMDSPRYLRLQIKWEFNGFSIQGRHYSHGFSFVEHIFLQKIGYLHSIHFLSVF